MPNHCHHKEYISHSSYIKIDRYDSMHLVRCSNANLDDSSFFFVDVLLVLEKVSSMLLVFFNTTCNDWIHDHPI
ncbi:hypothetical protein BDA99DRAFT_495447 [Phascolomyces articulosus]|uniref:Uncharacterized protein n=1 Tax=Phascolomyces articulosus TaxID=60185 RepID=A0AAD5PHZ3_9FUNG|nr:hypothetical protein BDA99DRAFT_495447 [Phascolomyces articulosus]